MASPQHLASRSVSNASNATFAYEEPEPRLFSFNNPFGACPRCQGFGNTIDFDLNLVIPNKTLTLAEGAIEPWTKPKYKPLADRDAPLRPRSRDSARCSLADLTAEQQNFIISGDGKFPACAASSSTWSAKSTTPCPCFPQPLSRLFGVFGLQRSRLRREARQVKVGGKDICQVTR